MISLGIDAGIAYTKVVVMKDGVVTGKATGMSDPKPGSFQPAVEKVLDCALTEAGVSVSDAEVITATGKGKDWVMGGADKDPGIKRMQEPRAAAIAARHFFPDAAMVISVGADETVVVCINEDGSIGEYTINQKCAAGIGILFESIGQRVGMSMEEAGSLEGGGAVVNDGCAVFAELDVLSLLNRGVSKEQAVLAAIDAMAVRASTTINDITNPHEGRFVMIGGLAKNAAFVKALEKKSKKSFSIPENAEYACAIAAAASV